MWGGKEGEEGRGGARWESRAGECVGQIHGVVVVCVCSGGRKACAAGGRHGVSAQAQPAAPVLSPPMWSGRTRQAGLLPYH